MGAPYEDDKPQDGKPRRVRITRGFYLDQYEVTVEQFAMFMRKQGTRCLNGACLRPASEPTIFDTTDDFDIRPGAERLPIEFALLPAAVDYCRWVGKRLPTEAEWELAARHDPITNRERLYPWGDSYKNGVTNCARETCDDGFDNTAPVGKFATDRSPIGAYDMGGNVSEWVNDCYRQDFACDPCIDPSITTDCEQVCVGSGSSSRCFDQVSVLRGGDASLDLLKAKNRIQALGGVGGGIRCAIGKPSPPS
jgi:formylglycine-generating enzyme required for sulfatase activity